MSTRPRHSNSCHSCKQSLTNVQYVQCATCHYRYCSRRRCVSKLSGTWSEITERYKSNNSNTSRCPHCLSGLSNDTNDHTVLCVNTNCQHRQRRYKHINTLYQHNTIPTHSNIQYTPSQQPYPTQSAYTPSFSPSHIVPTPLPMLPIQAYPYNTLPVPMTTHMSGIPPPVPSMRPNTVSGITQATVIPNTHIRANSDSYTLTTELDKILDQYAVMNSVQLYLASVQHPILSHTAIPMLVKQYNIPGHSLLTAINIQMCHNLPPELTKNTLDVIHALIERQRQRFALLNNDPVLSVPSNNNAIMFNTTAMLSPSQQHMNAYLTTTHSTMVPIVSSQMVPVTTSVPNTATSSIPTSVPSTLSQVTPISNTTTTTSISNKSPLVPSLQPLHVIQSPSPSININTSTRKTSDNNTSTVN